TLDAATPSSCSSTGTPSVAASSTTVRSPAANCVTGWAVAVTAGTDPNGCRSGQNANTPSRSVKGAVGTVTSRAPSKATSNRTPSTGASGATAGWWLFTNRKPRSPSPRTAQRTGSSSGAGSVVGLVAR